MMMCFLPRHRFAGVWGVMALLTILGAATGATADDGQPEADPSTADVHPGPSGRVQDQPVENPGLLAKSGLLLCDGLDNFVDAKGFERNALMNRDVFVSNLSAKNGCSLHAWPQQQAR